MSNIITRILSQLKLLTIIVNIVMLRETKPNLPKELVTVEVFSRFHWQGSRYKLGRKS